jgi:PAS domain S-box-containing protein
VEALPEESASKTAASILVLLIDDEESQMELTKLNLELADPAFTITTRLSPIDALGLLPVQPFECIVSDYKMRGMNGIQFCAEVKKTSTIPFIIYTGRGSEEVASSAFAAGVDDYVMKEPALAHYKVLAKRIRHAVEKRRVEEALTRTKALGEKEINKMRDLRRSGIELIGDIPWGTHFCQFYKTKQDLLDTLVPYFKAGIEGNEFCMWVTSEPLGVGEAKKAMEEAVPGFQGFIDAGQIEIIPYGDWYLKDGSFDSTRVLQGWIDNLEAAQKRGFSGLRLTGNTFWLEKAQWDAFTDYEEEVNRVIGQYNMIALCTYSLDKCNAEEIIDVVKNHQFALIKREGRWVLIESKEQREALAALRVSEENYHRLFTSMTDGFAYHKMIYDDSGKPIDYVFLEVNDAFAHLTGLICDEILGKRVTEVIPGILNDPNKLIEIYGKIAITGESVRLEIHFEPLQRWYSIYTYSPQRDYFVVIFSDISEKKRTEEEMAKLASFPQLNPNPIIEADFSGKIHYLNPAATSLFPNFSRTGSINPLKLDWDEVVAQLKHDEKKGLLIDVDVNGVWYSLSLHLVSGRERMRVYLVNINERKRDEQALKESNEMLASSNEELTAHAMRGERSTTLSSALATPVWESRKSRGRASSLRYTLRKQAVWG